MTYGSIYKIQFPNGKHYIGLTTTSLENRQKGHKHTAKRRDTKCLYNALRKYDMVDTFELIGIDTADTLEELCEKEIAYILEYNSYYMNGNGYNMTHGGEGTNGYVFTEEDRQKNGERKKKYYEDNPDARQKNSEAVKKYFQENPEAVKEHIRRMKEHWEKPGARARQSKITTKFNEEHPEVVKERGKKIKEHYEKHPEAREKQSEIKKEYHEKNPQARIEHSEIMKKLFEDPDFAKEHSERQKKRFENPEERKRYSEMSKKQFENPEARQKHSEIAKKRFENPEARQRMSEIAKNRSPEWIKKRNDTRGNNKPFDVFTKDGTFLKTFTYIIVDAKEYLQKEHNITSSINIGGVLKEIRNSSAGFVFKYKEF